MDEIHINKPIEDCTFLDLCKGVQRQLMLKELKEMTLEQLKAKMGNDSDAEAFYKVLRNAKEGYLRIVRLYPSPGEPHDGWTYAFAEGMPLHLDRPDEWYSTSNIRKIDWESGSFVTKNSVYAFEFLDEKEAERCFIMLCGETLKH